MREVEALSSCRTPVVPDGNYTGFLGDSLVVEDLSQGVSLLAVVVQFGLGRFGGGAKAEEVGEEKGIV